MTSYNYEKSWSNKDVINYFSNNRNTEDDIYDSEKYFLDQFLKPDMRVLDFGCAAGGFLNFLSTKYGIEANNYHGIDISPEMIAVARRKFPKSYFSASLNHLLKEQCLFDLIYSFGVLHMILDWRDKLEKLYQLTRKYLLFDLRLIRNSPSIEDITQSYQKLRFQDEQEVLEKVPYVILNEKDAINTLRSIVGKDDEVLQYGYERQLSDTVTSPYKQVLMNAFCIVKHGCEE